MFKPLLALSLLFAAAGATAADAVTDSMQATYAPYRVALFATNNNAQDQARQAGSSSPQSMARGRRCPMSAMTNLPVRWRR